MTELAEMVGIYARKIMELERRLAEAELAIVEHNDGCEQACMAGAKDRCLSYTSRNLQCPDCPRDWMITYDAARADKGGRHPSTQMTLDRVAAETDAAMRAKFAEADGAGESTRTCKSCGFVAKSDGWLNCPRCTAAATPPAEVK